MTREEWETLHSPCGSVCFWQLLSNNIYSKRTPSNFSSTRVVCLFWVQRGVEIPDWHGVTPKMEGKSHRTVGVIRLSPGESFFVLINVIVWSFLPTPQNHWALREELKRIALKFPHRWNYPVTNPTTEYLMKQLFAQLVHLVLQQYFSGTIHLGNHLPQFTETLLNFTSKLKMWIIRFLSTLAFWVEKYFIHFSIWGLFCMCVGHFRFPFKKDIGLLLCPLTTEIHPLTIN